MIRYEDQVLEATDMTESQLLEIIEANTLELRHPISNEHGRVLSDELDEAIEELEVREKKNGEDETVRVRVTLTYDLEIPKNHIINTSDVVERMIIWERVVDELREDGFDNLAVQSVEDIP